VAFVSKRLDARLNQTRLSGLERRLAMELVYGVVRRSATLDALLRPHVRRQQHQVEASLWVLLRLGAYQLVFLPSIPTHAAVHATVQLAKRLGEMRWHGFVNGVLRSLARAVTPQYVEAPGPCAVPVSDRRYRLLEAPVFPNPDQDPADYFASAFSFPDWLVTRWRTRFDWAELLELGFWFDSPPHLCLRVNRLRNSRDEYFTQLTEAGLAAHPGTSPDAIWLESSVRIGDLPGFQAGAVSVQDESAMQAAPLLAPQPGERVLDLCAAPGGKTTHLAELMQNRGYILATDVQGERLSLVASACRRLGIEIIETQLIDLHNPVLPDEPFDAALVDVPCSNTGVLGKRPEARWRIALNDLRELPNLQLRLLRTAVAQLRPGGRVVYSTCSIEPEENEHVVRAALAEIPGLQLVREVHHRPGHPADGGYQALLQRDPA
jgi:16S rRNA (cytosine967-C5)-methyltransferase